MHIHIKRIDDAFNMQSTNEDGNTVETDASPTVGGSNKAMRPMQMVLSALGSCSSIDVIHILNKQRQKLEDIQIEISGERQKDVVPALFEKIHLHFKLKGDLSEKKVKQAVDLSMEKYCSVAKMIEKTAKITYEYSIEKGS